MLHCINPEAYQVDETHLQDFTELVKNRENLGGIFSGLVPSVSNVSLRRNLETLQQQFPEDTVLMTLCQQLIPLIGTFSPIRRSVKKGSGIFAGTWGKLSHSSSTVA